MKPRATRRSLVGAAVLAGLSAPLIGRPPIIATQDQREADDDIVGKTIAPSWTFIVHTIQDPYAGELLRPQEPEPDVRYVGVEVEIRNESAAPLNFAPSAIRLVDTDGVEHTSGAVVGSEPRLLNINMLPGERTRGWIWYGVPETGQLAGLVYAAPSPRLYVPLSPETTSTEQTAPTGAGTVIEAPRPAHIRAGSCPEVGEIVAPLNDLMLAGGIENATGTGTSGLPVAYSFTTVPLTLDALLEPGHAITIQESADTIENTIACGNLGGTLDPNGSLIVGLREANDSGYAGIAVLSPSVTGGSTDASVFIARNLTRDTAGEETQAPSAHH